MGEWVKNNSVVIVTVTLAFLAVVYGYGQLTDHIAGVDDSINDNTVALERVEQGQNNLLVEVRVLETKVDKLEQHGTRLEEDVRRLEEAYQDAMHRREQ